LALFEQFQNGSRRSLQCDKYGFLKALRGAGVCSRMKSDGNPQPLWCTSTNICHDVIPLVAIGPERCHNSARALRADIGQDIVSAK
jgi:hypothetical protein